LRNTTAVAPPEKTDERTDLSTPRIPPTTVPAPDRVLVRDSKNPTGPTLTIPTPAWRTFLTTLATS
jgi:hypothetical protein